MENNDSNHDHDDNNECKNCGSSLDIDYKKEAIVFDFDNEIAKKIVLQREKTIFITAKLEENFFRFEVEKIFDENKNEIIIEKIIKKEELGQFSKIKSIKKLQKDSMNLFALTPDSNELMPDFGQKIGIAFNNIFYCV
jgi:RNA polymerase subunit RPABC4/transcription elongation factor Spt4